MSMRKIDLQIYTRFIQGAALTGLHREEMKQYRGFTDETIDALMFRSGRKGNKDTINEMRKEFSDEELHKAGLLEEVNKSLRPSSQLVDNRIIIPYIHVDGKTITLVRPHKLGLTNVNIQPYCRFLLKDNPEHIVLTEGEFKSAALWQWGIPSISIPGISSFGNVHFSQLENMLKEYGAKKVTVIFDNEIKDNPELPGYKEKPVDRFDAYQWAYIMAYKIRKIGIETRIGQMPKQWMKDGKIDFDMALAQGKTKQDIASVIETALIQNEFINSLNFEAQRVVRRKISQYFYNGIIKRYFHKYEVEKGEGAEKVNIPISNFVINIVATYFTDEGCMREVEFVNEFGERSGKFFMEPQHMVGDREFRKYCLSRGNYIWEGSGKHLVEIWKYELKRDMGDVIYMPEKIGEIEPGFWMFSNIAIKEGKVYQPDSDGIFWIEGRGFKPQSLTISAKGEAANRGIPTLNTESPIDIQHVAKTIKESIGGYEAYMGIGWVVATLFSKPLFKEFNCFPILFAHGKRESGKTTFIDWLMHFFGITKGGESISESTQNYIMRALSYHSSLAVWLDEYRNERRVTDKDGYLRGAWNRQSSGKGVKSSFGARSYSVDSGLIVSGEEMPKDSGLYTRLIQIQLSSHKRERKPYDWIEGNKAKFSYFAYQLLLKYDERKTDIVDASKSLKEQLVNRGISDRTAENWAMAAASYCVTIDHDPAFIQWVLESCEEVRQTAEQEHILNVFWNDVSVMDSEGYLGERYVKRMFEGGKQVVAVWYAALYNAWAKEYRSRTGQQPFDKASISKYIKEEQYFVGDKVVKLGKKSKRCYLIDIHKAPETISELGIEENDGYDG